MGAPPGTGEEPASAGADAGVRRACSIASSSTPVRGIVVRSGERLLIRRTSSVLFETALKRAGVTVSERLASKALSRWLPVLGALGVGAYAFYDTREIARTAIQTFASDMVIAG
jgi:hypothetical protein